MSLLWCRQLQHRWVETCWHASQQRGRRGASLVYGTECARGVRWPATSWSTLFYRVDGCIIHMGSKADVGSHHTTSGTLTKWCMTAVDTRRGQGTAVTCCWTCCCTAAEWSGGPDCDVRPRASPGDGPVSCGRCAAFFKMQTRLGVAQPFRIFDRASTAENHDKHCKISSETGSPFQTLSRVEQSQRSSGF